MSEFGCAMRCIAARSADSMCQRDNTSPRVVGRKETEGEDEEEEDEEEEAAVMEDDADDGEAEEACSRCS